MSSFYKQSLPPDSETLTCGWVHLDSFRSSFPGLVPDIVVGKKKSPFTSDAKKQEEV